MTAQTIQTANGTLSVGDRVEMVGGGWKGQQGHVVYFGEGPTVGLVYVDLIGGTMVPVEGVNCQAVAEPIHLHDLSITVSAGDLEASQLTALRTILEREVQALVERVNVETYALTGTKVGWYVSYDGSHECGAH